MRRISPARLLRSRVVIGAFIQRAPRSLAHRSLSTTSINAFPRSGRPISKHNHEEEDTKDDVEDAEAENIFEELSDASGSSSAESPQPFARSIVSLVKPQTHSTPLPASLQTLHHQILTSFLPANQYSRTESSFQAPRTLFPPGVTLPGEDFEDDRKPPATEDVVTVISPFEGGLHYVQEAVYRVASEVDAEVLRFDLALGLGLSDKASPLDPAPPLLSSNVNPLFQIASKRNAASPFPQHQPEEEMEEEEEDGPEPQGPNAILVAPMSRKLGSVAHTGHPGHRSRTEWSLFFDSVVQMEHSDTKRRIIMLESIEAMAASFDEWWPSLLEAVRGRRKDDRPTVIVLASSPSLLLPHTAPLLSTESAAVRSLHPMLQEIADRFGGMVETKVDGDVPIWWGSEERDVQGRQQRDQRRLAAIIDEDKGPMSLLPKLGAASSSKQPRSPFFELLSSLPGRSAPAGETSTTPWPARAIALVPDLRDPVKEALERTSRRSLVNAALVKQAIAEHGGDLAEPMDALSHIQIAASKKRSLQMLISKERMAKVLQNRNVRVSEKGWANAVRPWSYIRDLASGIVGRKLAAGQEPDSIQWDEVLEAAKIEQDERNSLGQRIRGMLPKKTSNSVKDVAPKSEPDSVIERIKKAKDLTNHEKRLLPCIVDISKLSSTTFKDVHLPYKTVDAVRTIISLPLLFPEAFRGGVLKDHATTGALLFGPPGTGKTLLARAVANESGARMLAIQPGDVNDKYFGEGEKLVKAVFSLARRLSPCVVFLDEVDTLFGARSSKGAGSGSKAHDQLLTEFMQEMDGLSSAEINKEKRVVVIGATNRPFDLDDAVLRRLPRRLLVDLPGRDDRKAILQILLRDEALAEDVDIDHLAGITDGFSGSDLKHLCVSAALSAVKDMVKVPWQTENIKRPASSSASSPSGDRETEGSTPCIPIVNGTASEAVQMSVAPTLDASVVSVGTMQTSPSDKDASESAQQITDLQHRSAKDGTPELENKEKDLSSRDRPVAQRTLSRKHFDVALTEIRASSSEEGTLPELRKWADQFGEGGTQKGRKKGFGKGFGFGEQNTIVEQGYGKVKTED